MPVALSIAGFDPTAGAGVAADLRVFQSLGVHGVGAVSSLTVQDTRGVGCVMPVPSSFFRDQLGTLLADVRPRAAKTGMLYDARVVRAVCAEVARGRIERLVIDPVFVSTSGRPLIGKDAQRVLIGELVPRGLVVTPNIPEAALLAGMRISGTDDMRRAAERIAGTGVRHVLIKGGHLGGRAVDILYDGCTFLELSAVRRRGDYHGTGCVFSAALTAHLALGRDMKDAFRRAKRYTGAAIRRAVRLGHGMRILGAYAQCRRTR